jgi:CHASE3 domain sensor protein
VIPYVNEILFAVALLLLLGISLTSYFSIKKEKKHTTL